jgi:serine/threonine protein kinase
LGLKGERVGAFTLDRLLARTAEGEGWKALGPAGAAAAVRLYYAPAWAELVTSCEAPPTVDHPNLGALLAFDAEARPPFTATRLVEGSSLAHVLAEQPYVPLGAALPLVLQLARALEALHAAGEAHRDLRPGNVLVDEDAQLTLVDAQAAGYRAGALERLLARGASPAGRDAELAARLKPYLAPEALRGEPAGPEADMYAFGVLVYRMLTGEAPSPIDLRYPSTFDARIPKVFDEVALACLERRVRARLENAIGLEQRLATGLERGGYTLDRGRPPSEWVRATPWRNPSEEPGSPTGAFRGLIAKLARGRTG